MLKHQQVTAILKKAGYTPMGFQWVVSGNTRRREMVSGYSVSQFGKAVGIECCAVMDKINDIIKVLADAGLKAEEIQQGCGYLRVTN